MRHEDRSSVVLDLVLAFHAGLLDLGSISDEELRATVHRQHGESLACADSDSDEHLPAWLMAAWPAIAVELTQLESNAVERHLSVCDSCAEEFSILLEIRSANSTSQIRSRAPRPRAWATRAWALVATAAALVLLLRGTGPPAGGDAPLHEASHSVLIPAPLRGQATVVEFVLGPGTRAVRLDLGQLFPIPLRNELRGDGTERLWMSVLGPVGETELMPGDRDIEDFSIDPSFELRRVSGEVLAPGRYECSVWSLRATSAALAAKFSFELLLSGVD